MKLNSHNEWDKLKEIIVGTAKKTTTVLSWKKNQNLNHKDISEARKLAKEAYPKWFLDEVEEDLDKVAEGKIEWQSVVSKVYNSFKDSLEVLL